MCKDTPEYSEFACKRDQWIEWLSGKDPHSITNQIIQMVWDAAVWRVINEARGLAPDAEEGGVQLNGDMHRLIDRTSFQSQAAAIRRLMDKSRVTGNRGVYSLYGLENIRRQSRSLCADWPDGNPD